MPHSNIERLSVAVEVLRELTERQLKHIVGVLVEVIVGEPVRALYREGGDGIVLPAHLDAPDRGPHSPKPHGWEWGENGGRCGDGSDSDGSDSDGS